jgi:hypothetical protein
MIGAEIVSIGVPALVVTKNPGDTLRVDITIKNTGTTTYKFVIGCSIGTATYQDYKSDIGDWHDTDIYNDTGNPDICSITGQPANAYVCKTIAPGATATVYRTFYLDPTKNPWNWNDVYVRVLTAPETWPNPSELARGFAYDQFSVAQPTISAEITNISLR